MRGLMVLLAVLLVIGCSDTPGKGVLEEKKMINVIWDLMQADEFATTFVSRDSSLNLKKERLKLYADVYRIHGLDEETFSESYKYYTERPDQMKKIFDSLTTKGEKERQLLYQPADTSAARTAAVADSLRSATHISDSLRIDSLKKSRPRNDSPKALARFPDSLRNKNNILLGRARQAFLIDSLRKSRIQRNKKP